MVCPNCKSTDIITVQDQRFCIACGQVLPLEKPTEKPKANAAVVVASNAPDTKRRKPGRPKASRLDAPQPEAVTETTASTAAPEAPIQIRKFAQPEETKAATVAPVQTPAAVLPAAPAVAGAAANRPRGRSLSDLAPKRPRPAAPSSQTPSQDAPAPTKPQPKPAEPKTRPEVIHLEYGAVESASLQDRFRPAIFHWSLIPAGLIAVMAGGLTWILAGHSAAQAWYITMRAGWPVWGEFALILALFYLARSVGAAATIYGAARRADHRPTPASHQLAASVNSLASRIGFDLVTALLQLAVVALGAVAVITGGAVWPVPEAAQITALFLAYLVLAYLLVGLNITQSLGRVALTLGTISPWKALSLGWGFFRRHFELVGFRFVSLLVELVLALPLFAAVIAMLVLLPAEWRWLAPVCGVLLALVGGVSYGAGTAVWWQASYRSLVHHGQPGSAIKLLTSRRPEKAHRSAVMSLITLAVLLGALATAWPWLPLG